MSLPHATVPLPVWVDIDVGIVDLVRYLNTIPGVRTHTSCQGTIGEGGSHPYRPYVSVTWTDDAFARLCVEFDVSDVGNHWCNVHPPGDRLLLAGSTFYRVKADV